MKKMMFSLLAILVSSFLFVSQSVFAANEISYVRIETTEGNIDLEIDGVRAPVTAANFVEYVKSGAYDGGAFHRTVRLDNQPLNPVKIEVIQAGTNENALERAAIPIERTSDTGIKHMNGTISMARNFPDSATSQFFICINDQPELDFGGLRNPDGQGFAAFGKVIAGMDVVLKIQAMPAVDQSLTPPFAITRATVSSQPFPPAVVPLAVVFKTSLGDFEIELNESAAPVTVANFLSYVDSGFYDGTIFHRVVKDFVVQGGGYNTDMSEKPASAPIVNEAANGLSNLKGTVAMARTPDIHSADSQFFVNVVDNTNLDHVPGDPAQYGYAVFGKLVSGFEVIEAMNQVTVQNVGEYSDTPVTPIEVLSAKRKF